MTHRSQLRDHLDQIGRRPTHRAEAMLIGQRHEFALRGTELVSLLAQQGAERHRRRGG
jgi:hypothetical protein